MQVDNVRQACYENNETVFSLFFRINWLMRWNYVSDKVGEFPVSDLEYA